MEPITIFWASILLIVAASLFDVVSTSKAFRNIDRFRDDPALGIKYIEYKYLGTDPMKNEKNPLVRSFLVRFGVEKGLMVHRAIILPILTATFYLAFITSGGGFSGNLIFIFSIAAIYFGMMVRQYMEHKWRENDLDHLRGR